METWVRPPGVWARSRGSCLLDGMSNVSPTVLSKKVTDDETVDVDVDVEVVEVDVDVVAEVAACACADCVAADSSHHPTAITPASSAIDISRGHRPPTS